MKKLLLSIIAQLLLSYGFVFSQVDFSMMLQKGHTSAIKDAMISPDGKYLVSTGLDDQTIIWEIKTGREIISLPGSDVVSIFPDGMRFMTRGTQQDYMDIRELPSGKLLESIYLKGEYYFSTLKISPDSKYFITSDLNLYNLETREVVRQFTTPDVNWDLDFSPDGKLLLVGTRGSVASLFEVETGKLIRTFNDLPGGTYALSFSRDGKYVFTADNTLTKQWNTSTGALIRTFTVKGEVCNIQCSPDNKSLLIGSFSGIATLFDLATGAQIKVFGKVRPQSGGWTQFFPDGTRLMVDNGFDNGLGTNFNIWKLTDSKKPLKNFNGNVSNLYWTYPDQRNPLRFLSIDGAVKDQSVNIWDLSKGKIIDTYPFKLDYENISQIDFRKDTIIALLTKKEDIYLTYDVVKRKVIKEFNYSTFYPNFYILNDKLMMVVKYDKLNTDIFLSLDVIDIINSRILYSHNAAKFIGTPSSFSKNGQYAIIYKDRIPYLYDLPSATLLQRIEKTGNTMLSFDGAFLRETGTYSEYNSEYKLYTLPALNLTLSADYQLANSTMNAFCSKSGKLAVTATNRGLTVKVWDVKTNTLLSQVSVPTATNHIQFSPDEKFILISSKYLFDLENYDFVPLNGDYYYHGFSPDGKHLISSGHTSNADDKAIKVFHQLSDGKVIFTIVGIQGNNSDYVVYTPDGYFYTTRKANENIHYVKDGKVYLFDQFDFYFNRPDIVLERMGYADPKLIESYNKAFQKRKKKMGITQEAFSVNDLFNVPEISINSSTSLGAVSNKIYNLSVSASDKNFPITQLNVWVNSVPVFGKNGIRMDTILNTLNKTLPIELGSGPNKIEVSVINEIGVESLKESFDLRYDAPTLIKPDLYLVSIGVSEFQNPEYNLSYAAKDALDLSTLYKSRIDMFGKMNVISLTDSLVTKESILQVKEKLLKSRPDDLVILFIATHGLLDANLDYFLATNNINFDNPAQKGLQYEDFESLTDSIPSRKRLLFMDACNSGEVDKEEIALVDNTNIGAYGVKTRGFKQVVDKEGIGLDNSFELMQTMFNDLRKGNGAVVLSSASGKEFAYESTEWKNGVFTYALIEGLKTKKADLNKDTKISVSELKEYLIQRVIDLSGGKQHPISRKENLEFDFIIW